MNRKYIPVFFMGLEAIIAIIISIVYGILLPPYVPSRLDSNDPTYTKGTFIGIFIAVLCAVYTLFLLLSYFIRKIDTSFLHIPNKLYWLSSEENRNQMYPIVQESIRWIGVGVGFGLTCIFELKAELDRQAVLVPFYAVIIFVIAMLIFNLSIAGSLIYRLRLPQTYDFKTPLTPTD